MAKDNLFLGFARGKVGSVVFYRAKGVQVTRALNSAPSNPQTALQLLQRVCFKSSSVAYSMFQDICNHSFEGVDPGTPSQSRFAQRNVAAMRLQLADYINSGDEEEILTCAEANFNQKDDVFPAFRPFIMAEGHAPSVAYKLVNPQGGGAAMILDYEFLSSPTYDQFINKLGLSRGDQLTFLFMSVDDTTDSHVFNGFYYARVVLEPANGDFTTPLISGSAINSPNPRNEGSLKVSGAPSPSENTVVQVEPVADGSPIMSPLSGQTNSLAAVGVIVSRPSGTVWQRSDCTLVCRTSTLSDPTHLDNDHETGYLADAIASYKTANAVSTRYLNQAQKSAVADD